MRILIAEDDQVLADGLLRSLRGAGAVVDHVASGTEADTALLQPGKPLGPPQPFPASLLTQSAWK